MVYRCILPQWAKEAYPDRRRVVEGEFSQTELEELNAQYYNIYFLPNYPKHYQPGKIVAGSDIDTFEYVYIDMDLKEGKWPSKEAFLSEILERGFNPTHINDSGNGIHVYWAVSDLDPMSFLKLQRRLIRRFKTDEAVGQIYQLMRVPGTVNTKVQDDLKLCERLYESDSTYTCEELDGLLPALTHEDEEYCQNHYNKTYLKKTETTNIVDKIPLKFAELLRTSKEVKEIWSGNVDDRSKADYRLGHIMFASGFSREDAMSVLVNSAKALARAPVHRVGYAEGIVDKIWTFELAPEDEKPALSHSVRDILAKSGDAIKGMRFPCYQYLDDTAHGFRLGQVIGLVAGSGVGKTAVALNMFLGFVESNPDYIHFFIPLEQPANEIADRWRTMCGKDTFLHDKVHVISNYADDGTFRHLSFDEIKDYLLEFQKSTGKKVGCVVIDHIGALKKKGKNGENQDLMDICHQMKAFAVHTNTMLVMQSQAPREKAGIGDLELNKDAAYGTVYFESYCDYLITIWQPLKRCYAELACPTITALKFCKIRHKKRGVDRIVEDVPYVLLFDPLSERLKELTQLQEKQFSHFNSMATKARSRDRKTDLIEYTTLKFEEPHGKTSSNTDAGGDASAPKRAS